MKRNRTLPAVVLAAGFSRRMGRCKLTLTLDGEPLVRRAVRAALEAGLAPVFVTMRPDASPELRAAVSGFDGRVEIVPAPDARFGQAESLKAGVRRIQAFASATRSAPPGAMILLGDQPLVERNSYARWRISSSKTPTGRRPRRAEECGGIRWFCPRKPLKRSCNWTATRAQGAFLPHSACASCRPMIRQL